MSVTLEVQQGRRQSVATRSVVVSTAPVQLAPYDRHRAAVIITLQSAGAISVSFGRQPTSATDGIRITNAMSPLVLNVRDHGGMVVNEIWCWATGALAVNVAEALDPEN